MQIKINYYAKELIGDYIPHFVELNQKLPHLKVDSSSIKLRYVSRYTNRIYSYIGLQPKTGILRKIGIFFFGRKKLEIFPGRN